MTQPIDPSPPPAVEPIGPTHEAKRGNTWLNVLLGLAVFAAVGGIAFAAGRLTAPAAAAFPNGGNFPNGGSFPGGPGASGAPNGGNFPGGGFLGNGGVTIEGTVESKDADSITIKMADGQMVEISLPTDTTYHTEAAAPSESVQSGVTVRVQVHVQPGQVQGGFSASDVTVVP